MRPRHHDRIVLIGLCWLNGHSEFPPPPLVNLMRSMNTLMLRYRPCQVLGLSHREYNTQQMMTHSDSATQHGCVLQYMQVLSLSYLHICTYVIILHNIKNIIPYSLRHKTVMLSKHYDTHSLTAGYLPIGVHACRELLPSGSPSSWGRLRLSPPSGGPKCAQSQHNRADPRCDSNLENAAEIKAVPMVVPILPPAKTPQVTPYLPA